MRLETIYTSKVDCVPTAVETAKLKDVRVRTVGAVVIVFLLELKIVCYYVHFLLE